MHLSLEILLIPTLLPAMLRPPARTRITCTRSVRVFLILPYFLCTVSCLRFMRFCNCSTSTSIGFSIIGGFACKVLGLERNFVRICGRGRGSRVQELASGLCGGRGVLVIWRGLRLCHCWRMLGVWLWENVSTIVQELDSGMSLLEVLNRGGQQFRQHFRLLLSRSLKGDGLLV